MTEYGVELEETISLSDVFARVWAATPIITDSLNLTDTPTWAWVLAKTYSETLNLSDVESSNPNKPLSESFTLTDGDTQKQDIVQVAPYGGYISVIASETTLVATMNELLKILEREKAPRNQTEISVFHDGSNYNAVAVVKRH